MCIPTVYILIHNNQLALHVVAAVYIIGNIVATHFYNKSLCISLYLYSQIVQWDFLWISRDFNTNFNVFPVCISILINVYILLYGVLLITK